jgi:NADPH-dependent F420 reductase
MSNEELIKRIAIVGGTGKEGKGLAYRWAKAGYHVIIGSRDPAKAEETSNELNKLLSSKNVTGLDNKQAVKEGQIVVLTIPYSVHKEILNFLKDILVGKLIIDVTVPLNPPKVAKVQMPSAGSAAQEAQLILGSNSQLAAAFHNISYENLITDEQDCDCDVLVTGTSKEARQVTLDLVKAAGFYGWDAGPIENSVVLEGLTSVLIGINRAYGSSHAGIRITGVERKE